MDSILSLIETYGYLAVFVGAFLEGETVLAMGGFAAQRGYLGLPEVIIVAMLGGFLGDQMYFFLGRRYGNRILARFPSMVPRAARVDEMLYRYHAPLIVAIRFMYGFRIAGPIVLGMGRVSAGKFFLFNLLGACLWAILVAGIGFVFGHALELVLDDIKRYDQLLLGAIALFGVALWAVHRLRDRKRD
jgi:membrane protein DedA with SNARE-associated domain